MQGAPGAQRNAASHPPPSQPPQTAGAAGASRPLPGTTVAAVRSAPPGAGQSFGALPEDPSDDSGWETASEESAEYNADEAAGSESAAKKQKVTAGSGSKEHSKGVEGNQKQHPDTKQPAGKEVCPSKQLLSARPYKLVSLLRDCRALEHSA